MTTYTHLSDDQRELLERTTTLAAEVLEPIARNGEPGRLNRPLLSALA